MRSTTELDSSSGSLDGSSTGAVISIPGGSSVLEAKISQVGDELLRTVKSVIAAATDASDAARTRPQALARHLGLDKVLTSRVLKAIRGADPIQAAHRMPGPDPLRRFVRAAAKRGAPPELVTEALAAIDRFEALITSQVGDRSLLDAILSAWVPDARREFELRRKQSAFKAMSQLKGAQARTALATVMLVPSADERMIDVVWLNGLVGVHRVRPGAVVKISTRRMTPADSKRRPLTLGGAAIIDPPAGTTSETAAAALLIPEFCSTPLPRLAVRTVGQSVFYTLAGDEVGAPSSCDLMFAEVNRAELPRYVPAGSGRRSYFFADITIPAEVVQFDVLVHESLYAGQAPELRIYDTAFEGAASPNDPARDLDRFDLLESIEALGIGLARVRSSDVDRYPQLLAHVTERCSIDGSRIRGYRCRIDYPLYGSQVTMVFKGVEEAG